jgi:hypothetical protein
MAVPSLLATATRLAVAVTPAPILVSREVAAEMLSISLRHFNDHVAPHLRVVRLGQRKLYPVAELERWVEATAQTTTGPGGRV